MRTTLAFAALLVVAHGASLDVAPEWETFKLTFGRNFASQSEHDLRQAIFNDNLKYINQHNAEYELGLHTFTLGVNDYTDMTDEEFVRKFNNLDFSSSEKNVLNQVGGNLDVSALPKSVDWRKKGHVTPIKDQNPCGTCWAFSAIAALESAHFKKTGNLVSLSEQNVIECTTAFLGFRHTCNGRYTAGGWPKNAIQYAIEHGVDTEESYPYNPYTIDSDKCQFSKAHVGATFTDMVSLDSGDEAGLQEAVATVGTISVCIDAGHRSFRHYKSGVYNEPSCTKHCDHAVAVVGYDTTEDGEEYYIVRNSWGTKWGEDGYVKMPRNKDGFCGIDTHVVYPIA